jgi:hypothetical protein
VPHVYPDGFEIILSALRLFGISGAFASNFIMILFSTLGLIVVFLISRKIFNNEFIAFLVSLILLFIPGYWESTALPIPNTLAMFLIPTIFYFLIKHEKIAKEKIFLLGLLAASLSFIHVMSFEVFLMVSILYVHFILIFEKSFEKISVYLSILGLAFLFTSLWWIKLYNTGLEHLSVKEKDEFQMLYHYQWYLSATLVAAPIGLIIGLIRKNRYLLLLISWMLISWILIENYRLDEFLYKNIFTGSFSFLRSALTPNWGQRFFVYLSQPIAICVGFLLNEIYSLTNRKFKGVVRMNYFFVLIVFFAIFTFLIKDVYFTPPWFMHLVHDTWVSETELKAFRDLEKIMPKNSFIDADFPFSEAYFGITGRGAVISPQLRAAIPLNAYLDDYIGVYYANFTEAKEIMRKYGITHVALSDRIKNGGHFATTSSRWPYTLYSGINNADLEKFNDKSHFRMVYSYRDVEIFCLQPC